MSPGRGRGGGGWQGVTRQLEVGLAVWPALSPLLQSAGATALPCAGTARTTRRPGARSWWVVPATCAVLRCAAPRMGSGCSCCPAGPSLSLIPLRPRCPIHVSPCRWAAARSGSTTLSTTISRWVLRAGCAVGQLALPQSSVACLLCSLGQPCRQPPIAPLPLAELLPVLPRLACRWGGAALPA